MNQKAEEMLMESVRKGRKTKRASPRARAGKVVKTADGGRSRKKKKTKK